MARSWSVAPQDRDGDGFNETIDCNDADPAIRPGAIEVAGNAVDENCDGIVVPATGGGLLAGGRPRSPPASPPSVDPRSDRPRQAHDPLHHAPLTRIPSGATVTVTCKGRGCPKALKGKAYTKRNAPKTLSLKSLLPKPLRAGDVLTITVSRANATSAVTIITVRSGKKPSIANRCQAPGAKAPAAC